MVNNYYYCEQAKNYVYCLTKQLEEIHLLSLIFCYPGELKIHYPDVICDFNDFIDNDNYYDNDISHCDNGNNDDNVVGIKNNRHQLFMMELLRHCIDFSIFLTLGNSHFENTTNSISSTTDVLRNNEKIEIRIILPHLYPTIENANFLVYNSNFTKYQENFIKKKIESYINEINKSDSYVFQVIMWLESNLNEFLKIGKLKSDQQIKKSPSLWTLSSDTSTSSLTSIFSLSSSSTLSKSLSSDTFERLWIYTHHIKTKIKRQEIQRQAKNLELTGFCRPGTPGFICVEGLQKNTQEFWRKIKLMRWRNISIKETEMKQNFSAASTTGSMKSSTTSSTTSTTSTESLVFDIDRYRHFNKFEELFTNIKFQKNYAEMSISSFIKFLESHNCDYIKKTLFGFERSVYEKF